MKTPEQTILSLIKLKRVSAGEYRFESDKFDISISQLKTDYGGTNKPEWFANVSKKYGSGDNLVIEPYNHIMPTNTLREMKLSIGYFLFNEINETMFII